MASIRISGLLVLVSLGSGISPSVAFQPNQVDDALVGTWVVRGLKQEKEQPVAGGNSTKAGPAVARREEVIRLDGHKKPVRWMGFSPDATRLATGMTDGHVDIWDVAKAKKIRSLGYEPIRFVAFTPDGKQLVTAGPGRGHALQVRLWDPATGNAQAQLGAGGDFVTSVTLSPDGKLMVTSSLEKSVQAFALDATALKRIWSVNLGFRIAAIAISPDGQRIAVVGRGGKSARERLLPDVHPNPDPLQLLLDSQSEFWILDGATGKTRFSTRNLIGIESLVRDPVEVIATVAFSPDGKLLASSWDGTLWLQDAITGKIVRQLKGHTKSVISLAFSPDGKLLASCGADKVRIWDLATGQERAALPLAGPIIVLFSPDNQFLAASGGGVVRLWRERQARDVPPMPEQKEPKKDAAK